MKRTKMQLKGQNITVFDCEIKEEINKNGIGWRDFDKMGISVACAFNFKTLDYSVFMDDNLEELVELLNSSDIVSGFNIPGFDIPLVAASTKTPLKIKKVYDLLHESRLASGWKPGMKFPSKMTLDDHLEETFGKEDMKTAHGSEAPLMWKQGKIGKLVSYCIADVKRECKMFQHVWNRQMVKSPLHEARLLKDPRDLLISV